MRTAVKEWFQIVAGLLVFSLGVHLTIYSDLIRHGVQVEVHTFAGTPHGMAGSQILNNGEVMFPNFHLWETLADFFIQDVFKKQDIK